jgi:hypothetical protein
MPAGWIAAGSALVGLVGSSMQADAAHDAAGAQSASAQAGIAEQRRQFDLIQKILSPYVGAGTGALSAQQNLLGLNGAGAQRAAVAGIQGGPQFQAMLKQGETSILQNASATGGLRGGNVQSALGQFSPMLLSQLIQQQLGNYGGLVSIGQNAAAGVGNAGMQTGQGIAGLLQQQGAAVAGGILGQGAAGVGALNSIGSGLGAYYAMRRQPQYQPYSGESIGGEGLTAWGGGGF